MDIIQCTKFLGNFSTLEKFHFFGNFSTFWKYFNFLENFHFFGILHLFIFLEIFISLEKFPFKGMDRVLIKNHYSIMHISFYLGNSSEVYPNCRSSLFFSHIFSISLQQTLSSLVGIHEHSPHLHLWVGVIYCVCSIVHESPSFQKCE